VILGFRIFNLCARFGGKEARFAVWRHPPAAVSDERTAAQATKTKEMAGRKGAAWRKEGAGYNGEMKSIQTVVELSTHNCMLAREDFWFPLQLL